ncbi:MAG TPA: hypothetical protein VGE34_03495 [Candidatus Saccharimonadales bacterium]
MHDKEPILASEATRQALYDRVGELLQKDGFQLDEQTVQSDDSAMLNIILQRREGDTRVAKVLYDRDQEYAYRTQIVVIGADNEVKFFFDIRIPTNDEKQAVFDEAELASQAFEECCENLEAHGYTFPEADDDLGELMQKVEMTYQLLEQAKDDESLKDATEIIDEITAQLKSSTDEKGLDMSEADVDDIAQLPEEERLLVQGFLLAHARQMNAIDQLLQLEAELGKEAMDDVVKNPQGLTLTEADAWNVLHVLDKVKSI